MSIQINIGDHTSSEPNFIAVPANRLKQLQWARTKAKWITRNIPRADVYYRTLPGGRSLTELLADRDIWINFHPRPTWASPISPAARRSRFASLRFGSAVGPSLPPWCTSSHMCGVRGATDPQGAERAVLECGLGRRSERTTGGDDPFTPYDPTISG